MRIPTYVRYEDLLARERQIVKWQIRLDDLIEDESNPEIAKKLAEISDEMIKG